MPPEQTVPVGFTRSRRTGNLLDLVGPLFALSATGIFPIVDAGAA
jgi:hypothetical protein